MVLPIAAEPIPLRVDPQGTVRVGGTRLTLESVLDIFNQGTSSREIVEAFPDLELADVYAVITYYLRHRADVDAYLQEQASKAASIRRQIAERQGDQEGLRERLVARREERERK